MNQVSVHNSQEEVEQTSASVLVEGMEQCCFFASDGDSLPYCQFIHGADTPGPFSLLVFLHGVGSVGRDNWRQLRVPGPPLTRYAREHNHKTVILFPQCDEGEQWVDVPWDSEDHHMPPTPSRPMQRLLELLSAKREEFSADPARLYAGGISMGGYGAWDLVCRRPECFAALLAICGGGDVRQAQKLNDVAIMNFHGTADTAVPFVRAREMEAALRLAHHKRHQFITIPDGGHDAWTPAFADEDAMDWLFSQVRPRA